MDNMKILNVMESAEINTVKTWNNSVQVGIVW